MAAPKKSRFTDPSPTGAAKQLVSILSAFLAERLTPDSGPSRLFVALSGGRDSVVLLHALSRLTAAGRFPISLSAVHVHHGISPNAERWAAFCAELCREYEVPFNTVRVD